MLNLQHNMVSILYSVKSMIESHLMRVEEKSFNGDDERRLRYAEEILKRCHVQTTKALEISKRLGRVMLEQPDLPEHRRIRASVRYAWRQVMRHLSTEYPLSDLDLVERIPERLPPVSCNRTDLIEILYLLAKNALQAMDCHLCEKRALVIRVEYAYSTKEEPYVILTVADSGPGIEGAKLRRVFDPFFTTKHEAEGNGFGLYLARELIRKNKGRITVSSVEGFGTTFSIELPLYEYPNTGSACLRDEKAV